MHRRTGQDVLLDVVRTLAPSELEKLDVTCRAYVARPHPPQPLHRSAGDPLGAGVETAVLLPVLVAVVAQVLADLASGRIRAGGSRLSRWWRRRRERGAQAEGRRAALPNTLPELGDLTPQQLMEWALAQGRTAGLAATEADACARIIVLAVVQGGAAPSSQSAAQTNDSSRPGVPANPESAPGATGTPPS
ncbi:hypothetical protein [Streptomyces sp. SAI-149]|uniref:hypothetical protein n=1 Tax=unclassified Streptomyces TaxID=2593676 RepID=UPI002475EBA3|nr:hypothetical protein [Streptomyces sp. SAI-149]MDH6493938.1 hypothetical protein [Streptomyces sp. SAI-149]